MRALLWPTYTFPGNLGADSLYLIARQLVSASTGVRWHMVTPDWPSRPRDLPTDKVSELVRPMSTSYGVQEALGDPDVSMQFGPQNGMPVEAAVVTGLANAVRLSHAWRYRCSRDPGPVLAVWDLLARDDSSGEFTATRAELMHAAAGLASADVVYHESPIARKITLNAASRFLAPSVMREIKTRSVDVMQGVDVQRLLEVTEDVPKRERFTFYYGGRFSASKRLDDLAEVIDAVYRFGRDVDFVVTTGSLSGDKEKPFRERFPQVELHVGLPQQEAWRMMASCHASVCFSSHELFGMAFWEQIAAGLAVVMKTEHWNDGLIPPGYPLMVTNKLEAGARLRMLLESWEEGGWAWGRENEHAQWVQRNYDSGRNMLELMADLEERVEAQRAWFRAEVERGTRPAAMVELVEPLLDDGMTWTEYLKAIRKVGRAGKNTVARRYEYAKSFTAYQAYQAAVYLGYEDDLQADEPTWTKG